jgi:hypothetical protein
MEKMANLPVVHLANYRISLIVLLGGNVDKYEDMPYGAHLAEIEIPICQTGGGLQIIFD